MLCSMMFLAKFCTNGAGLNRYPLQYCRQVNLYRYWVFSLVSLMLGCLFFLCWILYILCRTVDKLVCISIGCTQHLILLITCRGEFYFRDLNFFVRVSMTPCCKITLENTEGSIRTGQRNNNKKYIRLSIWQVYFRLKSEEVKDRDLHVFRVLIIWWKCQDRLGIHYVQVEKRWTWCGWSITWQEWSTRAVVATASPHNTVTSNWHDNHHYPNGPAQPAYR